MRYFVRVDVVSIKMFTHGLATLAFMRGELLIPEAIGNIFFVHLFLVTILLAYFPFSKLMHMGGVFLSPTRNLANNSRMVRHINPWNDPSIKPHSYAGYEDEFREFMVDAGLPVEKELPAAPVRELDALLAASTALSRDWKSYQYLKKNLPSAWIRL